MSGYCHPCSGSVWLPPFTHDRNMVCVIIVEKTFKKFKTSLFLKNNY